MVRSDGSGSTAQFTRWMIKQHGGDLERLLQRSGRPPACGVTSFYPTMPGMIAQAGDLGVTGYVSQGFAEGAIGYVNYSYAIGTRVPGGQGAERRRLLHRADAQNVAVSLLKARINTDAASHDYLTQNLDGVYTDADPRNYPLSSYSYLVLPTKVQGQFNEAKGTHPRRLRLLRHVPGPAAVGVARLLADADQPGEGQLRPDPEDPGRRGPEHQHRQVQQPDVQRRRPQRAGRQGPPARGCDKQGATQCATGTGGAKKTPTAVKAPAAGGTTAGGTTAAGGTTGTGGAATGGGTTGGGATVANVGGTPGAGATPGAAANPGGATPGAAAPGAAAPGW